MKNQISVEYLGTFGWIMLVVMVTILTLSQFGLLDLGAQIPEECYLGEQIECKAQYIDENGNLVMVLESKYNEEISIAEINIENYFVDVDECTSKVLRPREEINLMCLIREYEGGDPKLFVEEKQKFDLILKIQPKNSEDLYEVSGVIVSDVLDEDISTAFNCQDLISSGGVVFNEWQCDGTIVSEEIYFGEGFCCDGNTVSNPCASAIPGGGECCPHSDCQPIVPSNDLANFQCSSQEYGSQCCEYCLSDYCDGVPIPGNCVCIARELFCQDDDGGFVLQ